MRTQFHWSRVLPLVVVLAFAVAAFSPTLVQAEGDVPEIIPPPEPSAPQTEEPAESTVTMAVQVLAEAGAQLVGEDGAIPLASQSSLTILCDPDPWFYCLNCSGGKSPAYTTIAGAISNWVSLKGIGMIYLEGDHTYTDLVDLDGTVVGFSTLKGIVWDNSGTTKPIIQGTVSIHGFAGGFTLQGIRIWANTASVINPALSITDNRGLLKLVDLNVKNISGIGADINHKGSVELLQVDVSQNDLGGMYLDTCGWESWEDCAVNGTIKITDSTFSFNGNSENSESLYIYTRNPIIINGFSAIGNKGDGLDIEAYGGAVTIKNAVLMNNSSLGGDPTWGYGLWVYEDSFSNFTLENVVATDNNKDGLYISTTGSVTLKNVNAYGNGGSGLRIAKDEVDREPSAKSVKITDSAFFENDNENLSVAALGPITLSGVSTHHSTNAGGAYLDNSQSIIASPITITNSSFNNNEGTGLSVYSKGNITLNTITASINNTYGVILDNTFQGATGGITILATYGVNTIHSNGDVGQDGLQINTTRNIILNKLYVSGSSKDGINVASASMTTNLILNDVSSWDNKGWGIAGRVGGTITWNRGGAWGNGRDAGLAAGGADLENYFTGLPRNIMLRDVVFDENLGGHGLYLSSLGSITLTNISANGNAIGAGIYYAAPAGQGGSFTILRTLPDGYNTINDNMLEGIFVFTRGNITLNRVQVNENNRQNAYLDSCQGFNPCQGIGTVTVLGTTSFPVQFNGSDTGDGLFINAAGNIKLSGVQVNQNALLGLTARSENGSVSVLGTGNQFSGNGWYPLKSGTGALIDAKGNISLLNFEANGNRGFGVDLENSSGSGNILVSATIANFTNQANENTGTGIVIRTQGTVLVNKVRAWQNDQGGMDVRNHIASLPKPVTITGSVFLENSGSYDGLSVNSTGPITLNAVTVRSNGLNGAYLDNTYWTSAAMPITVVKSSFDNNGHTGLLATASGTITLNSVTASSNHSGGVVLQNTVSPVNSSIILLGTNQFSGNITTGISIISNGAVSISGVAANFNGAMGIYILQANTVLLVNSQALQNNKEGVYSTSEGNSTVRNLLAFLNGVDGNLPGMDIASLNGKIYLYSSSFIGNYGLGFEAYVDNPSLDFFMSQVNYMGNFGGTYLVEVNL